MTVMLISSPSHYYSTAPGCGVLWSTRLSVCPQAYLWNRWTDQHKMLCAQIPCGRGSVLLRQRRAMLCTSGFMDDVTFGRNGREVGKGLQHSASAFNYVRDWGGVGCLWMLVMTAEEDGSKNTSKQLPLIKWQASYSSRSRMSSMRYGQESSTGPTLDPRDGWFTSISPTPLITLNTTWTRHVKLSHH